MPKKTPPAETPRADGPPAPKPAEDTTHSQHTEAFAALLTAAARPGRKTERR